MDYRQAGVDIEAGRTFVEKIRDSVAKTHRAGVLGDLGGFGGCFEIPAGYRQPVLVSGTDGVGTKLKIAQAANKHDTIGIDLVAMCVNDVLTSGAEPLFFLDYLATGKLDPEQLAEVVKGIAEGCQIAGCALLGGETAEMPGFYSVGEYDAAGFCVAIAEKSEMLNGTQVNIGDVVIGLASSGIHSNGYSLIRKIIETKNYSWGKKLEIPISPETQDLTLAEIFLTPTQIYVKPVLAALKANLGIHGLAHITGGGLPENLPRCLGNGQAVQIFRNSWQIPMLFQWLQSEGEVPESDMFNTFNMGIGLAVVVDPQKVDEAIAYFQAQEFTTNRIGEVIAGERSLIFV
ncbi:MAG: phosphoribosylformylglycinamidine cyclo-ligase [Pseudanabaena sp.]|uniref:phosphoribosylformylglycinamidine cyclo-ligase n=1 Tax=Pseudanabaena mucicola TaxID=71190 RepID=UPI002576C175|nr:phosphoribosylformylglycinamidine cyclo-ligase [Pseudanabaena mucicola]MCA6586777.1 phosphoribosylformylglycinamidine cyclo-ligase [Pseudanabaena sp. M051S1SP1A06QC]MCA6597245.1 phosphoribosylformylglycinamidine cyclo-ligase [Pseudanabaena sp. M046S1SP1A06QC]MCA6605353.1 phosphoribosylformylglycinamidine cyclo-ligase [Pseudanabaena sp. M007S1SP1A06QC]MCA6614320.1 phosphoribosylformylglycinamidine cyclo-ligase [Pseudanabaena sp. M090S1SP1A06QC]MCE2974838.1 phosphoribosylformylglycinamidine c